MAGHSHSANIKFRKDRVDAKRSRAFSKAAQQITVAVRMGGGDLEMNPRLRLAIEKARVANMPKDNIQRAIKKGIGESGGERFEEILYEGYGPCGVAVMLDIVTDKRTRTAPEIRKIFERTGGNLASNGSVAFNFDRKAVFVVAEECVKGEDELTDVVLEAGADDLVLQEGLFAVHADASEFISVKEQLESRGIVLADAQVTYVPKMTVDLESPNDVRRVLALIDTLEDHDDVQAVAANHSVSDALAEQMGASE